MQGVIQSSMTGFNLCPSLIALPSLFSPFHCQKHVVTDPPSDKAIMREGLSDLLIDGTQDYPLLRHSYKRSHNYVPRSNDVTTVTLTPSFCRSPCSKISAIPANLIRTLRLRHWTASWLLLKLSSFDKLTPTNHRRGNRTTAPKSTSRQASLAPYHLYGTAHCNPHHFCKESQVDIHGVKK